MIGVQMIAAGHMTTAETLGSAVHRLATDTGLQETLRSDHALIPVAIEEVLRLDLPPTNSGGRRPSTSSFMAAPSLRGASSG